MWWTHYWVQQFFSDGFNAERDIPAAVKYSSRLAWIVAVVAGIEYILAFGFLIAGGNTPQLLCLGLFLGLLGTGLFLAAVIMERLELMAFMLLWDKQRDQKEEMRRLEAADL